MRRIIDFTEILGIAIVKTMEWGNVSKTEDEISDFIKNDLLKDEDFLNSIKRQIPDLNIK